MVLKTEIRDRLRNSYSDSEQKYLLDKCITEYFKQAFEYALDKLHSEVENCKVVPKNVKSGYICDNLSKILHSMMIINSYDFNISFNVENGIKKQSSVVYEFDPEMLYNTFSSLLIKTLYEFINEYNPVVTMVTIHSALNNIQMTEDMCTELLNSNPKNFKIDDIENILPNVVKAMNEKSENPEFILLDGNDIPSFGLITLIIEFFFNHVDVDLLYNNVMKWFNEFQPLFYKIIEMNFSPANGSSLQDNTVVNDKIAIYEDVFLELLDKKKYCDFEHVMTETITSYYTGKTTDILFKYME